MGFDPLTVKVVASYYTDWAIPAHDDDDDDDDYDDDDDDDNNNNNKFVVSENHTFWETVELLWGKECEW